MGQSPRNPPRRIAGRQPRVDLNMMHRLLLALLLSLGVWPTGAHEVSTNRVTLVLREANHISLTLRVNLIDLLRSVLAPKVASIEFLAQCASMPTTEFAAQFLRVQSLVQSETRMVLPSGRSVAIGQWRWPDAARLQAQIRDNAMQMVVAPHDHVPELESEIYAEAIAKEDLSNVSLQLARQMRPTLIVNYRPHQVWMELPSSEVRLRF